MTSSLPLIEQVLVLATPSIVFVSFAAVLTGSFNARLALLNEAWGSNIATIAQKKAYLNSPDTKLKDNIRKRHERYVRNLEFSSRLVRKHLEMIRAGTYMVLVSFLLFVISTMLSALKPYNITLAYPATVLLWAAMLLDVVAVLLIFIDLWTSYAHLHNENMFLYKIKRMIIEDFRATGQLPAENGATQMEEHKEEDEEEHRAINTLVLRNAQFGAEAENEMNMQKAEVAITMKSLRQSNGENNGASINNNVEEESSESSTSSQSSSSNAVKQVQVEKPADSSEMTSSSEQLARGSDKVSRSSGASKSSHNNIDSSSSQEDSDASSS